MNMRSRGREGRRERKRGWKTGVGGTQPLEQAVVWPGQI